MKEQDNDVIYIYDHGKYHASIGYVTPGQKHNQRSPLQRCNNSPLIQRSIVKEFVERSITMPGRVRGKV